MNNNMISNDKKNFSMKMEDMFDIVLNKMIDRANEIINEKTPLLFKVSVSDEIYDAYINGFEDEEIKQHHRCNTCRSFIKNFGGIAYINNNEIKSLLWDEDNISIPEFKPSIKAMREIVESSQIESIFLSNSHRLGTVISGGFSHFSLVVPSIYVDAVKSYERMMSSKQDFNLFRDTIARYSVNTIKKAILMAGDDKLYSGHRYVKVLNELLEATNNVINEKHNKRKENIMWLAIHSNETLAHVKNSSIGALMDDIENNMDNDDIIDRFNDKTDPLKYQRPTSVTERQLSNDAKTLTELGYADSLKRRYATPKDLLNIIWKKPEEDESNKSNEGLFGHVKATKNVKDKETSSYKKSKERMTYIKFARDILPIAKNLEVDVEYKDSLCSYLTEEIENSKPIIRWDKEEKRNPVSWMYMHNSIPRQYGIFAGYNQVKLITDNPSEWTTDEKTYTAILIAIEGAAYEKESGMSIFPEILKRELKPYRKSIEAYNNQTNLPRASKEDSVCGLTITLENNVRPIKLRVTDSDNNKFEVIIDRYE